MCFSSCYNFFFSSKVSPKGKTDKTPLLSNISNIKDNNTRIVDLLIGENVHSPRQVARLRHDLCKTFKRNEEFKKDGPNYNKNYKILNDDREVRGFCCCYGRCGGAWDMSICKTEVAETSFDASDCLEHCIPIDRNKCTLFYPVAVCGHLGAMLLYGVLILISCNKCIVPYCNLRFELCGQSLLVMFFGLELFCEILAGQITLCSYYCNYQGSNQALKILSSWLENGGYGFLALYSFLVFVTVTLQQTYCNRKYNSAQKWLKKYDDYQKNLKSASKPKDVTLIIAQIIMRYLSYSTFADRLIELGLTLDRINVPGDIAPLLETVVKTLTIRMKQLSREDINTFSDLISSMKNLGNRNSQPNNQEHLKHSLLEFQYILNQKLTSQDDYHEIDLVINQNDFKF